MNIRYIDNTKRIRDCLLSDGAAIMLMKINATDMPKNALNIVRVLGDRFITNLSKFKQNSESEMLKKMLKSTLINEYIEYNTINEKIRTGYTVRHPMQIFLPDIVNK